MEEKRGGTTNPTDPLDRRTTPNTKTKGALGRKEELEGRGPQVLAREHNSGCIWHLEGRGYYEVIAEY